MSRTSLRSLLAPRPPQPPRPTSSRAGRNLKAAVPTALILLALVALSVLWRIELFVVLVVVALSFAVWEAAGAFLARQIRLPLTMLMAGNIAILALGWWRGLGAAMLAFGATVVACALWLGLRDRGRAQVSDAACAVFVSLWISVLGSFAVALCQLDSPAWMVAALILLPVANDTGGWAAGVLFGRHPLAPRISPKKTWEGLAGSILACLMVALLLATGALGHSVWWACGIGMAAVVCCTAGDLLESRLKRWLGVKDMGAIFPGHGGMLDRIDSILLWAPFCYLFFAAAQGVF